MNSKPLTTEELALWQNSVDRSGMQGLRVTRIQHYREKYKRQLAHGFRRAELRVNDPVCQVGRA